MNDAKLFLHASLSDLTLPVLYLICGSIILTCHRDILKRSCSNIRTHARNSYTDHVSRDRPTLAISTYNGSSCFGAQSVRSTEHESEYAAMTVM